MIVINEKEELSELDENEEREFILSKEENILRTIQWYTMNEVWLNE